MAKRSLKLKAGDVIDMPVVVGGQVVRRLSTVIEVLPGDEFDGGAMYVIAAAEGKPYRRNQHFIDTPEYGIVKASVRK